MFRESGDDGFVPSARKALAVADKETKERILSPSVQIVLEQLKKLSLTKTELAQQMGVSQDYIYRILNGRIGFPHARETIERMAQIVQVDPYIFAEFRELDRQLSISARLVWQRLREIGMTREELYQAMGGRISRPYFNSILRGDQPFPTNRAYIQMFALALGLPPTTFVEFGHHQAPRWTPKDLQDMEERTFAMFFDKMMASHGYVSSPMPLEVLDERKVMAFFLPKEAFPEDLDQILKRMGQLSMGFKELEKVSGVPTERLRALFTNAERLKKAAPDLKQIKRSLHMA
jgi:transcriptional regulator with XRE-family HTH domain